MDGFIERAKTYCLELLEPCKDYPFHNIHHTMDVWVRAHEIGMAEWLTGEELENLEIAALFHDTGFSGQYSNNEFIGAKIASEWLRKEGFPESRIEIILHTIMATVLFSPVQTISEKIIQDADLDNLGRVDSFDRSLALLTEMRTVGKKDISDEAFWIFTHGLISNFHFHTPYEQKLRNEQQEKNRAIVEKYILQNGWKLPEKVIHEIAHIK